MIFKKGVLVQGNEWSSVVCYKLMVIHFDPLFVSEKRYVNVYMHFVQCFI